jgi:hypothetical protein
MYDRLACKPEELLDKHGIKGEPSSVVSSATSQHNGKLPVPVVDAAAAAAAPVPSDAKTADATRMDRSKSQLEVIELE